MKLSEDLRAMRIERPSEWKMDEYIRMAEALETKNKELKTDYGTAQSYIGTLESQNKELVEAIFVLLENYCNELPSAIKQLILKRGCGYIKTETMDGIEYDCEYEYGWTCEHCPIVEQSLQAAEKEVCTCRHGYFAREQKENKCDTCGKPIKEELETYRDYLNSHNQTLALSAIDDLIADKALKGEVENE